MIIPKYARYDLCIKEACLFLESYDLIEYPINPFEIIANNKWGLIRYSELANSFNCTIKEVCKTLGSNDGFTIYDQNNYTIAYNDSPGLGKRFIFTLFHEIGHICLRHLTDFENTKLYRGSLSKEENTVLENEANAFARNVYAPAIITYRMKKCNDVTVANYFNISEPAAKTRIDFLKLDISFLSRIGLYKRMNQFYYRFMYKHKCSNCNYFFIDKNAKYCPICGHDNLEWGKSDLIYKGIKLNDQHKAVTCPVCSNELVMEEGEYCHICGVHLVNRCTNAECEHLSIGNARFCTACGERTTFNFYGLLKDWRKELEESEVAEKFQNSSIDFDTVPYPFEINQELPFD